MHFSDLTPQELVHFAKGGEKRVRLHVPHIDYGADNVHGNRAGSPFERDVNGETPLASTMTVDTVPPYGPTPPDAPSRPAVTQGALQSAITYLGRGLRADGKYEGVDEWDTTEHQWRLIIGWAERRGVILPESVAPDREGGREHDVRFVESKRRWLKFTKPHSAGYAVAVEDGEVMMLPATPLQYFQRCKTGNKLFGDDVELVGISAVGNRIVVSQPDMVGPFPDWEAIDRTFIDRFALKRLATSTFWVAMNPAPILEVGSAYLMCGPQTVHSPLRV